MSPSSLLWSRYRLLSTLLLVTHTTALFQTGSSPAIQDPLINPPPTTCSVAQDGVTSNTFPWTHNPTCVEAVVPSPEGDGHHGIHRDFCVYTNTVFNSGRGLSLITTPEVAAELTNEVFSPYFDDAPNIDPPWEMKEAKGKGKGLFATRPITAGDTLILKSPVLFVSKEALATPSRQRRSLLLRTAVNQLPEESRRLAMELSSGGKGGKGEVGDVAEELIGDLVGVNAIRVRVWDGTAHLIVVPEAARINHACRPNAFYRFNDYTLDFDVFALRDIQPGEELTFSYGFSELSRDDRRTALEANWGFTCTCPLCTANKTSIASSNERVQKINEIKSALPSGTDALPQLLGLLPELISLMEQESLIVELPMYEEILAYTWSAFGIEDRAKYWGGRARRHWGIIAGKESWESRRCKDLEDDVKAHYTWMSWEGEDPWEGVGVGHPWDREDHDHDHDHKH